MDLMENGLITVIVPVYNAEKYLCSCIDSILSQHDVLFECILIDDGSTDTSWAICQEYAAKDDRVKSIHKENGGVMSARSAGVKAAKGEYICFVDSDDTIMPDALAGMMSYIKENVAVVVFESNRDCVYSTTDYAKALLSFNHWSLCGKLFHRRLFDDYVLNVPSNFRVGEDFLANLRLLNNIDGEVICKPIYKYLYNIHPQSATTSHKSDYDYEKAMISEVEKTLKALLTNSEIRYAFVSWEFIYLWGMIGLRYKVNYSDEWIGKLLAESKNMNLTFKQRLTVIAVRNPSMRIIPMGEKWLKRIARQIIHCVYENKRI